MSVCFYASADNIIILTHPVHELMFALYGLNFFLECCRCFGQKCQGRQIIGNLANRLGDYHEQNRSVPEFFCGCLAKIALQIERISGGGFSGNVAKFSM